MKGELMFNIDYKPIVLAASLSAASTVSTGAQNLTKQEIVQEFKIADEDQSYKLNIMEYLNYVAAQNMQPSDLNRIINLEVQKFNTADKNKDGELNIDEFTAIKNGKVQIKSQKTASEIKIDKEKAKKEAAYIIQDLKEASDTRLFHRVSLTKLQAGLKKINTSNVVEVLTTYTTRLSNGSERKTPGAKHVKNTIACLYREKPAAQNAEKSRLYKCLEERAQNAGCINLYNRIKQEYQRDGHNYNDTMLKLATIISAAEEN